MTSTLSFPRRAARGGTLVIGGGFAGSYVARRLGNAGATFAGWREVCGRPRSVDWLLERWAQTSSAN